MANTLARVDKRAARTAVVRSRQVSIKTTLLFFRCRNVIEQAKLITQQRHQIVAAFTSCCRSNVQGKLC